MIEKEIFQNIRVDNTIDATPDSMYPYRVLERYLDNNFYRISECKEMEDFLNSSTSKRNRILREAMNILMTKENQDRIKRVLEDEEIEHL